MTMIPISNFPLQLPHSAMEVKSGQYCLTTAAHLKQQEDTAWPAAATATLVQILVIRRRGSLFSNFNNTSASANLGQQKNRKFVQQL